MGGVTHIGRPLYTTDEPVHPRLGRLDVVLRAVEADIRAGHEIPIGRQRALSWFSEAYRKWRRVAREEGA